MKMPDLISTTNRLQKATRELEQAWQETQVAWQDQTAREFAQKYLIPITPRLRLVLTAAAELNEQVQNAQRDCRDDDVPGASALG